MSKPITGGCLCGAVTYTADAEPVVVSAIVTVSTAVNPAVPGIAPTPVFPRQLSMSKGMSNSTTAPPTAATSSAADFAPECGSAVYSLNSSMADLAFIRASSLDDPEAVTPTIVVYKSRAVSWDMTDHNLPTFDEMPEGGPQKVIADAI